MPLRPALGAVLGALTDLPAAAWDAWRPGLVCANDHAAWVGLLRPEPLASARYFSMGPVPWAVPTARAAWETLDARGLVPPGSWRFACDDCQGVGLVAPLFGPQVPRLPCAACALPCAACAGRGRTGGEKGPICDDCGGDGLDRAEVSPGFVDRPRTLPALVAWASLGFAPVLDEASALVAPGVLGAEELAARELLPGGVVSWRVARLSGAERPGDREGTLRRMGLLSLRGLDGVQVVVPPLGGWS